jgi:hypothetical protein
MNSVPEFIHHLRSDRFYEHKCVVMTRFEVSSQHEG